jgi:large subunit ribosomal protein L4
LPETLTAELYDASGTRKGEVELSPSIFGITPNMPVMHQVVTAQLAAARSGSASTKTRSEVRGGGRKPWRQKGLGRARHGSIRSPQWAGGGVAHGPKPRSYAQRTPKKMRRLALRSALSTRAAAGHIKVVETFDTWDVPKTKQAVALLAAMGVSGKVLLIAEDHERTAIKSFRNLDHVIASNLGQANTYDVLWADTIVMSQGTLDLGQAAPRGTEEHAEGVRGEKTSKVPATAGAESVGADLTSDVAASTVADAKVTPPDTSDEITSGSDVSTTADDAAPVATPEAEIDASEETA